MDKQEKSLKFVELRSGAVIPAVQYGILEGSCGEVCDNLGLPLKGGKLSDRKLEIINKILVLSREEISEFIYRVFQE